MATKAPATTFKVADLSLAAFGRKEIELAEVCDTSNLMVNAVC